MKKSKIIISTTSFRAPSIELCEKNGFEVVLNPYKRKIKSNELIELAKDAVGLIAGTEPITEEVLLKLPTLKVISRCGVGLDNIDLEAAAELGIKVFNTPYGPTLAVAELTIGLILCLLRKVNQMNIALRSGKWEELMGNLLYGKKVGIVGFGRIGRTVSELISVFGVELAYYDIEPKVDSFISCEAKGFEELLGWANIITLHLPMSNTIIGDRELKLINKGSWIINTSRGGLVDEGCLYSALKEKYLAGAAIDVFKQEPYGGLLKDLDNVIITPHIGSYAVEARIEMEKMSVKNLLRGLGIISG